MSKVKVEDLPILEDLDNDEAKSAKGGINGNSCMPESDVGVRDQQETSIGVGELQNVNIGIGELSDDSYKDDGSRVRLDDIKGESFDDESRG